MSFAVASEDVEANELSRSGSARLWLITKYSSRPAYGIQCQRMLTPIVSEMLSYWIRLTQDIVDENTTSSADGAARCRPAWAGADGAPASPGRAAHDRRVDGSSSFARSRTRSAHPVGMMR